MKTCVKVVVTGALGHIGSRVIRQLPGLYPEAQIVMVDNMMTQRYCSLFKLPAQGKYRFVEADVRTADMNAIVDGADVVLHLAAATDAASSFKQKDLVETVNYESTVKVAEACRDARVPMILISSTSVYGTQREVVAEDCSAEELRPQSPYAETKLREERFLRLRGEGSDLRFVICRFGTICGVSPGMRFHTAVNKFCWQAVMGQPLTIWRTALHQKRPYLSLDDAVEALTFILKNDLFDGQTYNVLTENLTVQSIVKFISEYAPRVSVEYVDAEVMNQLSYEVSNERFKERGFQFRGSIRQCIGETIGWLEVAGGIGEGVRCREP